MGVFASMKQWLVVHLLFAITFFTSGLIINFFQCILYIGLRPISKYLYRKINYYLCYSFYCRKYLVLYYSFCFISKKLMCSKLLFQN